MSILDTDLYKLTMQQAVLFHFPTETVEYKFYNRAKEDMKFSRPAYAWFQKEVARLSERALTKEERSWLERKCPFFSKPYLDFLETLRLRPDEQVEVSFSPVDGSELGDIEIAVKGKWCETILYEVPLMALLSEAYFQHKDVDWSIDLTRELAKEKGAMLLDRGITFSEFGTRRRRSYAVHKLVLEGLLAARTDFEARATGGLGRLAGTSNVHFAQLFDLAPIGTIAHEWTMGIAALQGYANANTRALDLWEQVYPPSPTSTLHIALTDTLSTSNFLSSFSASRARAWKGLRQDSGSPIEYARKAKQVYDSLGVSTEGKVLIFSDGLDVERCVQIKTACDEIGIASSFGVGTFLTNDFDSTRPGGGKSRALNIVIKLSTIEGSDCVKISDELTKNTGDAQAVKAVKKQLGLSQ